MRMNLNNSVSIITLVVLLIAAPLTYGAGGACKGKVLNPVTDICWQCMFPVKMGSVSYGNGAEPAPGNITSPVCACPDSKGILILGVSTAFWEHARLIETVKDPFCFPVMGTGMTNPKPGFSSGENRSKEYGDSDYAFQQAHYFYFPAWSILKLFMDSLRPKTRPYDLAT